VLEGPVTDLYHTPVALVVGTISPDPLMRRLCARAAERYLAWWDERFHTRPRIFTDTEITWEDQGEYSLLLFGGPDENAVARAMADDLPLAVSRNLVTLAGHEFPVRDAAVQMIYPNPRNIGRYVVVRAATSAPAMALTDYVLNDVDFCIIDGKNADPHRAGTFFDAVTGRCSGTPILAGYFDNAWQFDEAYLEQDAAPRHAPRLAVPRVADAASPMSVLPLADLVESKAEGVFLDMFRNDCRIVTSQKKKKVTLTGGLSVVPAYWLPRVKHGVEFDLAGGRWTRLRATLALQADTAPAAAEAMKKAPMALEYLVKGDGVVLYRSPAVTPTTPPFEIDVDLAGVDILRLEFRVTGPGIDLVDRVDWGNIRLERPRQ